MFEKIIGLGVAAGFISMCLFALYSILFWLPTNIYAEAECLRNGYPEYRVSIGLERYCMTLDGVITVRVDKQ